MVGLAENSLDDACVDMSLWRNQGQTDNQQTHELEVIHTVTYAVENVLGAWKQQVSTGDLMAGAEKRHTCNISGIAHIHEGKGSSI